MNHFILGKLKSKLKKNKLKLLNTSQIIDLGDFNIEPIYDKPLRKIKKTYNKRSEIYIPDSKDKIF